MIIVGLNQEPPNSSINERKEFKIKYNDYHNLLVCVCHLVNILRHLKYY